MEPWLTGLWIAAGLHILITWFLAVRRGLRARRRNASQPSPPLPTDFPPVSIIVPAWNEKGTVERCIAALQKIDYPQWEAIIMAGGSDGTYQAALDAAAGDPRLRVLERGPEPKNEALNRGIAQAAYDVIVLLDADSIVFPGWLTALLRPLLSGASASYGFYLPLKDTWISMQETMVQYQYHIQGFSVFPGCASVAVRREVLARVGNLTVDAYSWEDWDLYARLADAGERIVPVPSALLYSDRPATFAEFWHMNQRAFRTHLAGLWRYRAKAARRPLWALYELFFLAFGSIVTLALLAGLVAVIVQPSLLPMIGSLAALLLVWIFGRRASIGAEVVTFTGDSRWLARTWAPLLTSLVQFPAALFAVLTAWKQPSFDYKGRREQNPPPMIIESK